MLVGGYPIQSWWWGGRTPSSHGGGVPHPVMVGGWVPPTIQAWDGEQTDIPKYKHYLPSYEAGGNKIKCVIRIIEEWINARLSTCQQRSCFRMKPSNDHLSRYTTGGIYIWYTSMKNGNLRSEHTKLVKANRHQEKLEIYDTPQDDGSQWKQLRKLIGRR